MSNAQTPPARKFENRGRKAARRAAAKGENEYKQSRNIRRFFPIKFIEVTKCSVFCSCSAKFSFLQVISPIPARIPSHCPPDEEARELEKAAAGDNAAREKLIKHNLRLVAHIAKKYAAGQDMDDLISIGSIGLVKGISTFSAAKGTTLATYLARCIENEILMTLRTNKRYKNTVYLQEQMNVDSDGNELTLMDVLSVKEDSIFKQVEMSIVSDKLDKIMQECLSKREYSILVMRFGLKGGTQLTQLQTAKALGISRSYVSRIETKALSKIRAKLNREDFLPD